MSQNTKCQIQLLKILFLLLCLFYWKTFYIDSFPVFSNIKKNWSTENYLQSTENSYKNKAYFLQVVFQKKKNGKQSLSHTVHSSYKYYFLLTQKKIFSFTHSAFLTINSLTSPPFVFLSSHTLTIIPSSLFSSHIFLSLSTSPLFSSYIFSPL